MCAFTLNSVDLFWSGSGGDSIVAVVVSVLLQT